MKKKVSNWYNDEYKIAPWMAALQDKYSKEINWEWGEWEQIAINENM